MQIVDIDRIMVAAPDVTEATDQFESLLDVSFGDVIDAEVEIGDSVQRTSVSYARPGIEVIAPDGDDDGVARYLEESGPGLFGVVYRVEDIEAANAELSESGIEPIADEEPNGVRELHYHPSDFGGAYTVLTEYSHPGFASSEGDV